MTIQINKQKFFDSDEAKAIRVILQEMTDDPSFNTKSTYVTYSSSDVSFVDRHMKYLGDHQKVNPRQYLSNLRLMTRLTARSK